MKRRRNGTEISLIFEGTRFVVGVLFLLSTLLQTKLAGEGHRSNFLCPPLPFLVDFGIIRSNGQNRSFCLTACRLAASVQILRGRFMRMSVHVSRLSRSKSHESPTTWQFTGTRQFSQGSYAESKLSAASDVAVAILGFRRLGRSKSHTQI